MTELTSSGNSFDSSLRRSVRFSGEGAEKTLSQLSKIREIAGSSEAVKKGLPVYYPGAGSDIVFPLAMTNARNFVFVDYLYVAEMEGMDVQDKYLQEEIEEIGGKVKSVTVEGELGKGGKKTVSFEWQNQERTIVLYAEDATKFVPPELKDGASFVVIKAPTPASRGKNFEETPGDIWSPENISKIYRAIANGGFFHWEPMHLLSPKHVGFRRVLGGLPKNRRGGGEFALYQKVKDEPEIEVLLRLDRELWVAEDIRHGYMLWKIDGDTLLSYTECLKELRKIFEGLSVNKRKEILADLKKYLIPDSETVDIAQLIKFGLKDKDVAMDYVAKTAEAAAEIFPEILGYSK